MNVDLFRFTSILKDKTVFELDYIPPTVINREPELRAIAHSLMNNNNLFLYGGAGTGKTVSINYVSDEYHKQFHNPLPVEYIRLDSNTTLKTFLEKLYNQLKKNPLPNRYNTQTIIDGLKNTNFYLILDEFDKILEFPDLVRVLETLKIKGAFITNKIGFTDMLDTGILYRLAWHTIHFKPYTPQEISMILTQRSQLGLNPNTINEDQIAYLSNPNVNHGDARAAIKILYEAAILAEHKFQETITDTDLKEAEELIQSKTITEAVSSLSPDHKIIILALGNKK